MALPQQVVEQLSHGSARTPGWSSGILLFSGSILFIVIFIYAGLQFGYKPYLGAQLSSLESQTQKLGQSISPSDKANLIAFYSQVVNLQSLIKNHVFFSQFLTWLEQNTEANIYYTSMVLSSNNQITFDGIAKTPADITEQIAAFEASPEVAGVSLSNATFSSFMNGWTFNVVLTMQPSVFTWTPGTSPSAAVTSAPAEMSATTTSAAATGASGAATSTATP